jgi:hypothetical protein
MYRSLHSVVGIATVYGLDDRENGARGSIGSGIVIHQIVQTDSDDHPASSYTMCTSDSFPGGKGAEA